MKRILVCGGRDYNDYSSAYQFLCRLDSENGPFKTVIHGGARGADQCGAYFAHQNGREEIVYKADWKAFGKSAGPRRNQQMLVEGKPDIVVAFPGGRGTADMVYRARQAGIPVIKL